ncbi:MAG: IS1595 family transposase [Albidovulum sp.]|nr:IS1595 family transposase [Albidovulum sp.]
MPQAPGKNHRKGISMIALTRMFPNDEAARDWIESIRWPDGPKCPYCRGENVQHPVKHKTMTHRCRTCRKWFSVRTGTVMQNSKLGYQVWVFASYLMSTSLKGESSMKLHRNLEITQKTAWHLAYRLRETWGDKNVSPFGGPVEADETYMGGKRANRSNAERKKLAGRGPVDMTAVVGVKDRETNQIVAKVVADTNAKALQGFVEEHTQEDAQVYTDEGTAYVGIDRPHESVKHSAIEYVRGDVHTNGLESAWSMIKRGHKGTYRKMSEKYLHRYVREFVGRHNVREADTIDQMRGMVANMQGRFLPYRMLKKDNGLSSGARS